MDINRLQNFYHVPKDDNNRPCYFVNIATEHGIWQSDNPLSTATPLLISQLAVMVAVFQLLRLLLKPFRVPQIVSDILGGVILGEAGHRYHMIKMIQPLRGLLLAETMGYWFLCLHLFFLGLSTDVSAVFRTGKKATMFAISSILIPFAIGTGLYFLMDDAKEHVHGCFFFAAMLSITGFPVVARTLTDLRIIHSDIGRMAVSASLVNDLASWVLLAVLLPSQIDFRSTLLSVFLTIAFTAFCFYCVRPCLAFLISRTFPDKVYSLHFLNLVLASVSMFACASDALGTSPMVGAFVYGLMMPSRELAAKLLETFNDTVTDILLPVFFSLCGWRFHLLQVTNWGKGIVIIVLASVAKVFGCLAVALFYGMSRKEGLALGVAMNGKGILAVIILLLGINGRYTANGKEMEILTAEAYALALICVIVMTAAMPFLLGNLYRPAKRLSNYQGRTIRKSARDSEFRILTCFQGPHGVLGMINLLDSSNATKDSPLSISALNLIDITGRNSSMLIVHSTGKSSSAHMRRNPHIEQILTSLETYSTLNEGLVSVQAMSLLSPYVGMHEDICSLAEDKQVTFIILPFHKQLAQDGTLEDINDANNFRAVNLNVLGNAPCTVGIFVDKGFGDTSDVESNLKTRQVAVIFIGGPDDREALAYASRIAGSQGLTVTVIRFLPGDNLEELEPVDLPVGDAHRMLTSISYVDKQRRIDDECIDEFRLKCSTGKAVTYIEKFANNEQDMVSALKEGDQGFDLYIVGKGEGIISPLTAGLMDWCEFHELGALGDLLVTSSFARHSSVLVIQQYAGAGDLANLLAESDEMSTRNGRDQFSFWDDQSSEEDGGLEMESFKNKKKNRGNTNELELE